MTIVYDSPKYPNQVLNFASSFQHQSHPHAASAQPDTTMQKNASNQQRHDHPCRWGWLFWRIKSLGIYCRVVGLLRVGSSCCCCCCWRIQIWWGWRIESYFEVAVGSLRRDNSLVSCCRPMQCLQCPGLVCAWIFCTWFFVAVFCCFCIRSVTIMTTW